METCHLCVAAPATLVCTCERPPAILCSSCLPAHISANESADHKQFPIETFTDPPKQSYTRCSECEELKAGFICTCVYPWKAFCKECGQTHTQKKTVRGSKHSLESIEATDFLITEKHLPEYFERQYIVDLMLTYIRGNLSEVDTCISHFDQFASDIQSKVTTWLSEVRTNLVTSREHMRVKTAEMCKELQSLRYKRSVGLDTELAILMTSAQKERVQELRGKLKMFSYEFKPYLLTSVLADTFSYHESYAPVYASPRVAHFDAEFQRFMEFSLSDKCRNTKALPDLPMKNGAAWCLLPETNEFLYCGGQSNGTVSGETLVVNTVRLQARRGGVMEQARFAHAIAYWEDNVYVFGGCFTTSLQNCENFNLKSNRWARISDLIEPRHGASACAHKGSIYIAGGLRSAKAEVFNISTNMFTLLALTLPNEDMFTTVIMLEEELLILQGTGLYGWNLKKPNKTLVRIGDLPKTGSWFSPMQPYEYKGVLYLLRSNYEIWEVLSESKEFRLVFPLT